MGFAGWRRFNDAREIGLTLAADGAPLEFLGKDDKELRFALPKGAQEIRELLLTVDAFVPKELGLNEDMRALGISLRSVRYE